MATDPNLNLVLVKVIDATEYRKTKSPTHNFRKNIIFRLEC